MVLIYVGLNMLVLGVYSHSSPLFLLLLLYRHCLWTGWLVESMPSHVWVNAM